MRGLSRNLSDLTVASSQFYLLCSETLVSDGSHISGLLVHGFGHPVLLCRDGLPRAVRSLRMRHFANPNLSLIVSRCWYLRCVVLDRTSTCSVSIVTLTQMIVFTNVD